MGIALVISQVSNKLTTEQWAVVFLIVIGGLLAIFKTKSKFLSVLGWIVVVVAILIAIGATFGILNAIDYLGIGLEKFGQGSTTLGKLLRSTT